MPVAAVHGLYGVVADTTVVGAITRQSLLVGADVQALPTSDQVFPTNTALYGIASSGSFTTLAIADALTALPYPSKSIAAIGGAFFGMFAQARDSGGQRTAGSTHRIVDAWQCTTASRARVTVCAQDYAESRTPDTAPACRTNRHARLGELNSA